MFDDFDLIVSSEEDSLADDADYLAWCMELDAEDRVAQDRLMADLEPDDEDNDWMARPF